MSKALLAATMAALAQGYALDADGQWVLNTPFVLDSCNTFFNMNLATPTFTSSGSTLTMNGLYIDSTAVALTGTYTAPARAIVASASVASSLTTCSAVVTIYVPGAVGAFVDGNSTTLSLDATFTGDCTALPECSNIVGRDLGTARFLAPGATLAPTTSSPTPAYVDPLLGDFGMQPPYLYSCGLAGLAEAIVDVAGFTVTSVVGNTISLTTTPATVGNDEYVFEGTISPTGELAVDYVIALDDGLCGGMVNLTGQETPWPRVNDAFGIMDLTVLIDFQSGICNTPGICDDQAEVLKVYKIGQPIPTFAPTSAPTSSPTAAPKKMNHASRSGVSCWVAAAMLFFALRN
jgi:hypothetical protein